MLHHKLKRETETDPSKRNIAWNCYVAHIKGDGKITNHHYVILCINWQDSLHKLKSIANMVLNHYSYSQIDCHADLGDYHFPVGGTCVWKLWRQMNSQKSNFALVLHMLSRAALVMFAAVSWRFPSAVLAFICKRFWNEVLCELRILFVLFLFIIGRIFVAICLFSSIFLLKKYLALSNIMHNLGI